jgi:hypothetical protein
VQLARLVERRPGTDDRAGERHGAEHDRRHDPAHHTGGDAAAADCRAAAGDHHDEPSCAIPHDDDAGAADDHDVRDLALLLHQP